MQIICDGTVNKAEIWYRRQCNLAFSLAHNTQEYNYLSSEVTVALAMQ